MSEKKAIQSMETLDSHIKEISEKHMKKRVKRKIRHGSKMKIEPIWMTSEISKHISKRRKYNKVTRMYRKGTEEYTRYKQLYKIQRNKKKRHYKKCISVH